MDRVFAKAGAVRIYSRRQLRLWIETGFCIVLFMTTAISGANMALEWLFYFEIGQYLLSHYKISLDKTTIWDKITFIQLL